MWAEIPMFRSVEKSVYTCYLHLRGRTVRCATVAGTRAAGSSRGRARGRNLAHRTRERNRAAGTFVCLEADVGVASCAAPAAPIMGLLDGGAAGLTEVRDRGDPPRIGRDHHVPGGLVRGPPFGHPEGRRSKALRPAGPRSAAARVRGREDARPRNGREA